MPTNLGQSFGGVGPNHTSGFVPDPGAYGQNEQYLRADGEWANPGVDELRDRFNRLVEFLLALGIEIPTDLLG